MLCDSDTDDESYSSFGSDSDSDECDMQLDTNSQVADEALLSGEGNQISRGGSEENGPGNSNATPVGLVAIIATYKMGWAKCRRATNSTSGVGTMVGLHSGKVLIYESWCNRCRICEVAKRADKKTFKA